MSEPHGMYKDVWSSENSSETSLCTELQGGFEYAHYTEKIIYVRFTLKSEVLL